MKAGKFLRAAGLLVAMLASIGSAQATLAWSWSFDDYHPVVGQNDSVVLMATIYNDASSSEVLTAASIYNGFITPVEGLPYHYVLPTGGFLAQFAGMHLNPNESFSFNMGSYVPDSTPVAPGEYIAETFGLYVFDSQGHLSGWTPDRDLYITVEQRDGSEVPEPASLALVFAGVGGAWLSRRRKVVSPRV